MPDSTRGSIYISTADEIGETLVEKLGGSGYTPNEWDKSINLCGISDADIPTALENIEESADGTERGSFAITKANAIASVLNKKFKTTRGFKPKEWASAVDKLTALQVKNASGAIASFKDGADDVPIASASFSIVPYQNLNGYSKPWASGCGNNKLALVNVDFTLNNVRYYTSGGYFCINGTSTGETSSSNNNFANNLYFTLDAGTYYFSRGSVLQGLNVATYLYKKSDKTQLVVNNGSFTLAESTELFVGFYVYQKTFNDVKVDIMLNIGSSALTYEPYSNVCPITPYSQMTILQHGRNYIGDIQQGGIDATNGKELSSNTRVRTGFIRVLPNTQYTCAVNSSNPNLVIFHILEYGTASDSDYIGSSNVTIATKTFTTGANTNYLRFTARDTTNANVTPVDLSNWQLEKGGSASAYMPYKSDVIGDNFGRSVYGGSRASDGTLTETHKIFTLNGSSTENYSGSGNCIVLTSLNSQTAPNADNTSIIAGNVCSHFPQVTNNNTYGGNLGFSVSASEQYTYIYFSDGSGNMTAEAFKTWLQNNPITLVLKVKAPTAYSIDPLPEINSYYGDNNIYTDIVGGESSVNYRADIDLSQ